MPQKEGLRYIKEGLLCIKGGATVHYGRGYIALREGLHGTKGGVTLY